MTSRDPHVIGRRIARRRHELDWSQKELARRIGVSPSSVANWERGHSFPLRKIGKVEQVLGISLDEPEEQLPPVPPELEAYRPLVEDIRKRYPRPADHMPMLEAIAATLRGDPPPNGRAGEGQSGGRRRAG